MRTRRGRVVLALAVVWATAGGAMAASAPSALADEDPAAGRLVLVLDSSGSMKEPATDGTTKIEAARSALRTVVGQLPDTARVGIRVFGAKVFSRKDAGACTDTQSVVPVRPLDRNRLTDAVADYKPYGETPIGNALLGAAKDLGPAEKGSGRTIVLLSDGEPTCAPDPCQTAKRIRAQGIDLRINVVGLDVSGSARAKLRCIARAGGGRYVDAQNAQQLTTGLIKTSVRDLRVFSLSGKPVTGAATSEQATSIEPGRYTDTTVGREQSRYYLVDKPKGGGVSASVLARPPKSEKAWHTVFYLRLRTPDGDDCGSQMVQDFQVLGQTPVVTSGVEYNQLATHANDECATADKLLLEVEGGEAGIDYQLAVTGYPAISNASGLPGEVEGDARAHAVPVPAGGATTAVAGGVNVTDAPEIKPGTTYADSIRPGEQLVYRMRVGYGQAPGLSARLGSDPDAARVLGSLGLNTEVSTINPLGQRLTRPTFDGGATSYGFYSGDRPVVLSAAAPVVRARNITASNSDVNTSTHDGYYYFVLGMARSSSAEENAIQVPVVLRADVSGDVTGAPAYEGKVLGPETGAFDGPPETGSQKDGGRADKSGATASHHDADHEDGGGVPWLPIGLGATVIVLAAAAGGWVLGRRRSARG